MSCQVSSLETQLLEMALEEMHPLLYATWVREGDVGLTCLAPVLMIPPLSSLIAILAVPAQCPSLPLTFPARPQIARRLAGQLPMAAWSTETARWPPTGP